jgi:hypothetical protein
LSTRVEERESETRANDEHQRVMSGRGEARRAEARHGGQRRGTASTGNGEHRDRVGKTSPEPPRIKASTQPKKKSPEQSGCSRHHRTWSIPRHRNDTARHDTTRHDTTRHDTTRFPQRRPINAATTQHPSDTTPRKTKVPSRVNRTTNRAEITRRSFERKGNASRSVTHAKKCGRPPKETHVASRRPSPLSDANEKGGPGGVECKGGPGL